jgi:hypothetical protein
MVDIPERLFQHFASDPGGLLYSLEDVLEEDDEHLAADLVTVMAQVPSTALEKLSEDEAFNAFHAGKSVHSDEGRLWVIRTILWTRIVERRAKLLYDQEFAARPAPYHLPALDDLSPDADRLVPLGSFEGDGARLVRNGWAFYVTPGRPSPNASHWLTLFLLRTPTGRSALIRLDPLLYRPSASMPSMGYKMWMYGRPIDWDRIHNLKLPDHGRWMPTRYGHEIAFTDYSWLPRDDEVHFLCEEVPTLNVTDVMLHSGRYFHAVYSRKTQGIVHVDGAVRLYSNETLPARLVQHVRHAGKVGKRAKIFRIDSALDTEYFSQLAQAFFVWNDDVAAYFDRGLPA